jgi:pimeloyl-ACP methyl ester carboxylesterase
MLSFPIEGKPSIPRLSIRTLGRLQQENASMTPLRAIRIGILAILIGISIEPSIGSAGQIAASIE